jgi:hypothetical protein
MLREALQVKLVVQGTHRESRYCRYDKTLLLCRWAKDRYEGAVGALVHILKKMQATRPDACVLRPVLRDEARKAIGTNAL